MSEYTPTTREVRNVFAGTGYYLPAFDRWLADERRKAKAEALRESKREWRLIHMDADHGYDRTSNFYPNRRMVEEIQEVRGGVIQFRTLSEWEDA